jgi:hypothetical protein
MNGGSAQWEAVCVGIALLSIFAWPWFTAWGAVQELCITQESFRID